MFARFVDVEICRLASWDEYFARWIYSLLARRIWNRENLRLGETWLDKFGAVQGIFTI